MSDELKKASEVSSRLWATLKGHTPTDEQMGQAYLDAGYRLISEDMFTDEQVSRAMALYWGVSEWKSPPRTLHNNMRKALVSVFEIEG